MLGSAHDTDFIKCWLGDNSVPLVDVNTELTTVQTEYHEWIAELVSNYSSNSPALNPIFVTQLTLLLSRRTPHRHCQACAARLLA